MGLGHLLPCSQHHHSDWKGTDPTERSWRGQLRGQGERGSQNRPVGLREVHTGQPGRSSLAGHSSQSARGFFFLSFCFFLTGDRIRVKLLCQPSPTQRGETGQGAAAPGLAKGSACLNGLFQDQARRSGDSERCLVQQDHKHLLLPAQPGVSSREPSPQLFRDGGLNSPRRRAPILFFAGIHFLSHGVPRGEG